MILQLVVQQHQLEMLVVSVVTATQNRAFDVLQLQIGQITQPGTELTATLKNYNW